MGIKELKSKIANRDGAVTVIANYLWNIAESELDPTVLGNAYGCINDMFRWLDASDLGSEAKERKRMEEMLELVGAKVKWLETDIEFQIKNAVPETDVIKAENEFRDMYEKVIPEKFRSM